MSVQPRTVGRYRRLDKIGYGNFGVVYKGVDTVTNRVVAIKTLNLDTADDEVESVRHEVSLLSHLSAAKSSNVTRYYGTVLDGPRLWVIMDLCSGGSVRTLLRAGSLEEKHLGVLFREIMIGVAAIHSENIIHRDLKAANVLITMHGHVKLCDFGVAAVSQFSEKSKRNTVVGTPYWMAPEVIQEGQFYTNKADIWSLGITFFEIVTGNPPYAESEAMRALMLITNSRPPRLEGPKYPPALKDLVALCLDEDPKARPNAEELLKHKFIKQFAKTPTAALRVIVERYMQWKRARQDHRDSLLMFNPHPEEENLEVSDSDSVWDFGIDGESAQAAAQLQAGEPDDMANAPNSLRELYGVPPAASPEPASAPFGGEPGYINIPESIELPELDSFKQRNRSSTLSSINPQKMMSHALSRQKSDAGPRANFSITVDPPQLAALELGPHIDVPNGGKLTAPSLPRAQSHSPLGHPPLGHSPLSHSPLNHSPLNHSSQPVKPTIGSAHKQPSPMQAPLQSQSVPHLDKVVASPPVLPPHTQPSSRAHSPSVPLLQAVPPKLPSSLNYSPPHHFQGLHTPQPAYNPLHTQPAHQQPVHAPQPTPSHLGPHAPPPLGPHVLPPVLPILSQPHSRTHSPLHSRTPSLQNAKIDDKIHPAPFPRHRSTTVSVAAPSATEPWKQWRHRHDQDSLKRQPSAPSSTDEGDPAPVSPVNTRSRHDSVSESPNQSPVLTSGEKSRLPSQRSARAQLPQLQMPARPSFAPVGGGTPIVRSKRAMVWPSEFPPMPQVDLNSFLDSAPDHLVASTLLELATGFRSAVASLAGQFD